MATISLRKLLLKILTAMDDRVIHTGTTDGWTWRKWSSGKIECWQTFTDSSTAINTAHSNGYRSAEKSVTVPDIGFSNPKIFANAQRSNSPGVMIFPNTFDSTTRVLTYYYYRGSSTSSGTCYAMIYLTEG